MTSQANAFDLILENATVYDGSGGDGFVADVGIVGDTIEHVGRLADATGRAADRPDRACTDAGFYRSAHPLGFYPGG